MLRPGEKSWAILGALQNRAERVELLQDYRAILARRAEDIALEIQTIDEDLAALGA